MTASGACQVCGTTAHSYHMYGVNPENRTTQVAGEWRCEDHPYQQTESSHSGKIGVGDGAFSYEVDTSTQQRNYPPRITRSERRAKLVKRKKLF